MSGTAWWETKKVPTTNTSKEKSHIPVSNEVLRLCTVKLMARTCVSNRAFLRVPGQVLCEVNLMCEMRSEPRHAALYALTFYSQNML